MKTITYNPETHVLVPREPSEEQTTVDLQYPVIAAMVQGKGEKE